MSAMRRKSLKAKLRWVCGLEPARQTELYRLWQLKRYIPGSTNLLGPTIEFPDARSFLYMQEEIFDKRIYEFKTDSAAPIIIDGGANIGLATLFFKRLFPGAIITAFEPDADVRRYFAANIAAAGLTGITIEPTALWSSQTELTFAVEGADGGRLLADATDIAPVKKLAAVPTARLRDLLSATQRVDMLKLDIEGAEGEVMADCRDVLTNVRHLFVEYHSIIGKPQCLASILGILQQAGFSYHLSVPLFSPRPFIERSAYLGMDNQLNIFAYRI